MKTEMDIKTETDMELLLSIYIIGRNSPYSAVWIASDISRSNFQQRYILLTPIIYKSSEIHTTTGIAI
jgi:hypothetical protein